MRSSSKTLAILAIFVFAANVSAGTASSRLSELAELLIKNYASLTGEGKTTLAVFPFTCDEKLDKRRAGFAVSELMAHRFVADRNFDVVERSEVGRLLTEQRFQASGAVDSTTAVKLGKMLGAGVILVGNMQKVDGMYQVNARLVNAENGKVIVSDFAEFPVGAFEEDARVYLNLVPDSQTLGFYALFNYRSNSNKVGITSEPSGSATINRTPVSFSNSMVGGGLLYRPAKKMQLNLECATATHDAKYADVVVSGGFGTGKSSMEMTILAASAGYVSKLSDKWGYLAAAGLQKIWVNTLTYNDIVKDDPPLGFFLKAGMEFKPQSRVGIGLNLKYDLSGLAVESYQNQALFELSPLSVETVLAFYF